MTRATPRQPPPQRIIDPRPGPIRLLPLWLGTMLLAPLPGCGGPMPVPIDERGEARNGPVRSHADPSEGSTGQEGSDPGRQPDHPPTLANKLRAMRPERLVGAVKALPVEDLHSALERLEPSEPAHGWSALRVGRVLAHVRKFRRAEEVLSRALAAAPTHPAAPAMRHTLRRLNARREVQPNRIGVVLPVSGPYGAIGKSALAAIQLAVREEPGLEIVVEDSAGDARLAARAVEKLVFSHHVGAVLGPVGSLESHSAALTAERLEVPLITFTAREGIADLGTFIFRHRVTRSAQARTVARYAVEQMGLTRFAVLYPRTEYGRSMMQAFWSTVEALGGEMRGAQSYPVRATDFGVPLKKLVGRYHLRARRKDPYWEKLNRKARDKALHVPPIVDFEALFIPDVGERARLVLPFLAYWDIEIKTQRDLNPRLFAPKYNGQAPQLVQILGGSGFNNRRFAELAAPLSHNSVFVDAFLSEGEDARSFVAAYEAATGRRADPLAAHAFDATRMVAKAMRDQPDRDSIRRRLLQLRDFDGVVGRSTITGNGEAQIDLRVLTIRPDEGIVPRTEELGADDAPLHD